MRGKNRVNLMGNLGADPEVRHTAAGDAVANIRVATNYTKTDRQTGKKTQHAEWHRCVVFGSLAEIVGEHLHKGSGVDIEGRLRTRKWQGQDGQDRYITEVVVNELIMLPRGNGNGNGNGNAHTAAPASAPAGDPDIDDDIPF